MHNPFRRSNAQEGNAPTAQPDEASWWTTTIPRRHINPDILKAWLGLHFGRQGYDLNIMKIIFEISAPTMLNEARPCNISCIWHAALLIPSVHRRTCGLSEVHRISRKRCNCEEVVLLRVTKRSIAELICASCLQKRDSGMIWGK